ncbi:hypothetical protein B0H11DRAFT_2029863 [Mycena galericulata]|nr:hypothetical protein B0H11DRAFT_2029863 [Mycena galericulata]
MTISHPPTDTSFVRRRQSLSCRRRESQSLQGEGPNHDDSVWTGKVSPVSRINSGRNGTGIRFMDFPSDTLSTAFPVELRVEVFLHFCGMYCPIGKSTEGPTMLLKICRAWRELALQTPQLWNSFTLDLRPLPHPEKRDFLIFSMQQWIERSRNLPLSFKLRLNYPVFDATCTPLIQCILPSSPRWRDVSLLAPGASLTPLWGAQPNSFPTLSSLTVETVGPSTFAFGDLGLNWAQVTELDLFLITIPTLDECLRILKQGVSLRRCTMNAICVFSSIGCEQRLALPHLEHLGLTMYGGETGRQETRLMSFLGALSLTGLQSLRIAWNVAAPGPGQAYYWSDGHTRFIDFLGELQVPLKTLHLAYLPFNTRQLIECLRVVPSLTHLDVSLSRADVEHDIINDELLGALAQQTGCSGLVPHLQNIWLESHGQSFSNPALLRFIASRWRYQGPGSGDLESVDIVSPKRHAEYRPRRFKDLKEGRLEVAAALRSEFSMVKVLSSFLDRDSYGEMICFLNGDFPADIRSLLIFG